MHLVRPSVAAPAASSVTGSASVKIHTSTLFKILEIISRQVLPENKRVIGTLLGYRSDDGGEYEVRDAFMVPCKETGDSIAIEDHQHKMLYQLHKKAHPKETVLGWFGSSLNIDNTTGLIHDFYSKGPDRAYPYPAIYLNVEFQNENGQITNPQLNTYIGAAIGKANATSSKMNWKTNTVNGSYVFTPIPNSTINGTVSEKLVLNSLVENQVRNPSLSNLSKDNEQNLSQLSQEITKIIGSIDQLLNHLDDFKLTDGNLNLLRLLSNSLSTRPQNLTDLDNLKQHFAAHNNDVIMIEYLTKVVKEQIELSARLTANAESEKKDRS